MGRSPRLRFLLTAALFMIAAGSSLPAAAADPKIDPRAILAQDPKAGKLIAGVPFIPQKQYQCGPASVAMVLRFYGVSVDPDAIAEQFETNDLAGNLTVDLLIAASEAGMEAHLVSGDLRGLKQLLDQDRPVIVLINFAPKFLPYGHFAVAVGYLKYQGRDYIALHSGQTPWLMVPEKTFLRQWDRTGRMMMTVVPKTPAASPPNPQGETK